MTASPTDDLSSAERRIEELTKELSLARGELAEGREQHAATAGILAALSSSPADLRRVCADIAANAARLCDAYDATIFQVDGELLRRVANYGSIPTNDTLPLMREVVTGRAVLDKLIIHIADLQADSEEYPAGRDIALRFGLRTVLAVPLLRASAAIGVVMIRRREVRPFSEKQISLLKTFADQAVIAIANTRLFEAEQSGKRELQESLEYQTAMGEVLSVISRSTFELQPVLEAVVESATTLCGAKRGHIFRFDGEYLRFAAAYGARPGFTEYLETHPSRPGRGGASERAALEGRTIHIADVLLDSEYERVDLVSEQGYRTVLAVPMLREGTLLGVIAILKTHVDPFTDKQIALVETFADQAVIAIENTRLFEEEQSRARELTERTRELTETLEYQTATSGVLNVISRSPAELQPVFDFIARNASRLCGNEHAIVTRYDGSLLHLAAQHNPRPGIAEAQASFYPREPHAETSVSGRAFVCADLVHIPDIEAEQWEASALEGYRRMGLRAAVAVPMLHNERPIGVIGVSRGSPGAFSERQIQLLKTFADQAVIAIENARLFEAEQASKRELTDALERQTATTEVLSVISRSHGELEPVFAAMLDNAVRICGAKFGQLFLFEDGQFRAVGKRNLPPEWTEFLERRPLIPADPKVPLGRVAVTKQVVHVADITRDQGYIDGFPPLVGLVELGGARTLLVAPMLKEDRLVGAIGIFRQEVRPFTDKQIELVKSFASQAVIAIENARLFEAEQASKRELQESLEYQTATSEVLNVISRSPTNVQPVFDTIAQAAADLCGAQLCNVYQYDGRLIHIVATHLPASPEMREANLKQPPIVPGRGSAAARSIASMTIAEVPDIHEDPHYELGELARAAKFRSTMAVPMVKDGRPIGAIAVARSRAGRFPERQIELLRTFAEQAVIAIENTRLFEAEQTSKRELTEALEQQTATADVLKVISRSALDLQRVLDALVESAARLCDAYDAAIFQRFGDSLRLVAHHGQIPLGGPVGQYTVPLVRERMYACAVIDRRTIQVADILAEADEYPESRKIALQLGWRTALAVPLVHAGEAIGVIFIRRIEVRRFTERQIELVNTFADQAVIAIENTRLFEEVQTRTRELAKTVEDLEIASQHKNQFVANMSHELRTPLAAILGYAELIQEGFYEPQGPKSLDALTRIRSNGKHLLGLINTVLDIAKIESGQFTLNMSEYAMESVVETVRAATESLAQNKKLTLTTSVDKSLPVGLGDEQRLTQVLLNLVGNAIKFTDAGMVSIAATARNGHFAVLVTDTGPGIPLDQQDRIFEQFHQVDSSMTKAKGGTGLGLAIAKQIVEMHDGRIWVESALGKGSTFQMELPIRAEYRRKSP